MHKLVSSVSLFVIALGLMVGCSTSPSSEAKREELTSKVQGAMKEMSNADPSLQGFVDRAYGYVMFPSVTKGGLIVGGSYGRGEVYEKGKMVGYADISQATVGAQAGGQSFKELICFETEQALSNFKANKLAFAANASAVALKTGAAATARYSNGVAVFTQPTGGLMFEAAIGGQGFSFRPYER